MVRAVPCTNLVTTRKHSSDADRVLVGLGAAVGEKEGVDVTGCDLRELYAQPRAHFRGHERVGIRKDRSLLLNRPNHTLVTVPDIHAHQLAIEVDETLAFRRPEVDSLCTGYGNWVDCGLGGPLEERVPAAEIDDLLARHGF